MRKLPTSFEMYEITEEEINKNRFTAVQAALLKTKLGVCAEQKINLNFDGSNPIQFAQQEAYLSGQIELLRELLDLTPNEDDNQ